MNSKEKDAYYGVKPRNVVLPTRVALPKTPAKKPYPGYCKKRKGDHLFELDAVRVYMHRTYPHGSPVPCYVVGLLHRKEYRCSECGKKKEVCEKMTLDTPVLAESLSA